MNTETTREAKFWDKIAEKYARQPVADEEAYQIKLAMTRDYFTPESHVFEFGCGTGSTALAHSEYAARIDAMDLSSEMIAIAKAKAEEAGVSNVVFSVGDIAGHQAGPASYDVVLGHSVLHLLRNREATLGHVMGLLKPGGVFVTSTACLSDFSPVIRLALPLMRLVGKAPFVDVFSSEALMEEHAKAGFQLVHQWRPKKNTALFLVARKPQRQDQTT